MPVMISRIMPAVGNSVSTKILSTKSARLRSVFRRMTRPTQPSMAHSNTIMLPK